MQAIDKHIELIKGIHPGIVLERELKRRKISKRSFALSIIEYPQLLGDITLGKRRINPSLSIRIGGVLDLDESFFSILQTYYDIAQEKKRQSRLSRPDIKKFRPVVFWDTDMEQLDWEKYKSSIIRRVFERGTEEEKNEITRFYGKQEVASVLKR